MRKWLNAHPRFVIVCSISALLLSYIVADTKAKTISQINQSYLRLTNVAYHITMCEVERNMIAHPTQCDIAIQKLSIVKKELEFLRSKGEIPNEDLMDIINTFVWSESI